MSTPSDAAGREERLEEIVAEYLGRPDGSRGQGRRELLARHPEFAAELGEFFAAADRFDGLAAPLRRAAAGSTAEAGPRLLGDFRLVRELGRGGMGVVYEAEQVSLGRRVALKVLPAAATLDPRRLQRFRNEARAAAGLHHTHIVPVFAVGCEQGVHFYAMQLIDGQSLAEALDRLRAAERAGAAGRPAGDATAPYLPGGGGPAAAGAGTAPQAAFSTAGGVAGREYPRAVARLGVQAAEALEYAHQLGVVHRDVKPANLMLDGRGQLWVADFGLAQFLQADGGLTLSGDLVGTLRYMSPEQALAQRVAVDHRTDVYSLGATLYELLTLRPVHGGRSRPELLRQIAFDEPVPPRRLNLAVPAELETVVLKALEKNPAERYQTAQELADDLRRFLEDQPVRARRPTLGQRLGRWSRRHRALVGSAAAVLVIALVISTVSALLIARQRDVAQRNFETAERERLRAQANLLDGYRVLDEVYVKWAEERLPRAQEVTPADRDFLQKALTFYERFAAQDSQDPALREKTAQAHVRVGKIHCELGHLELAEQAARRAVTEYRALVADHDDRPEFQDGLAGAYNTLGAILHAVGRNEEALEVLVPGQQIMEQRQRDRPALAQAENLRGNCLCCLAKQYSRAGRDQEAERLSRQALEVHERLVAQLPGDPDIRASWGASINNLAVSVARRYGQQQAEPLYRQGIAGMKIALAQFPSDRSCRFWLAFLLKNYGIELTNANRHAEARPALEQAVDVLTKLASEFPGVLDYQSTLAETWNNLGCYFLAARQFRDAEAAFRKAQPLYVRLTKKDPKQRLSLAGFTLRYRARVLHRMGRIAQAEECYRRAVSVLEDLVLEHPEDRTNLDTLALSYQWLSNFLKETGREPEGACVFERARPYQERLAARVRESKNALMPLQVAWWLANSPCKRLRNPRLAVELATRAVELPAQEIHEQCWLVLGAARYRAGDWAGALQALQRSTYQGGSFPGYVWFFEAMTRWQLGQKDQARQAYDRALRWMLANKAYDDKLHRRRREAAGVLGIEPNLHDEDDPAGGRSTESGARSQLQESRRLREEVLRLRRQVLGEARPDTLSTMYELALVLNHLGSWGEARRLYERLLELQGQAKRERHPQAAGAMNNLAWLLATCEDTRLRDAARAVELATQATTLDGSEGAYWNTLGAARYRAGDWRGAARALGKSMDLRKGGDSSDWFFLAMTHWRLGEKDRARARYDQAVAWMEANLPSDPELLRFRAEAAALLGVRGSMPPPMEEPPAPAGANPAGGTLAPLPRRLTGGPRPPRAAPRAGPPPVAPPPARKNSRRRAPFRPAPVLYP
jgi:serine/threonine protein kinase/Flp pilus assembly protein TadD